MRLAAVADFNSRRIPAPPGKAGAYHTVSLMRGMVEEYKTDPRILNLCVTVIHMTPQQDQLAEVEALFDFVRAHIRYVRDPVGIESLADPLATLRRRVGDCDDQTALLATMFEAMGYPARFVLAGYNGRDYEHVYCQVLACGIWHSCDPTVSVPLGWEAPNASVMWIENRG